MTYDRILFCIKIVLKDFFGVSSLFLRKILTKNFFKRKNHGYLIILTTYPNISCLKNSLQNWYSFWTKWFFFTLNHYLSKHSLHLHGSIFTTESFLGKYLHFFLCNFLLKKKQQYISILQNKTRGVLWQRYAVPEFKPEKETQQKGCHSTIKGFQMHLVPNWNFQSLHLWLKLKITQTSNVLVHFMFDWVFIKISGNWLWLFVCLVVN